MANVLKATHSFSSPAELETRFKYQIPARNQDTARKQDKHKQKQEAGEAGKFYYYYLRFLV